MRSAPRHAWRPRCSCFSGCAAAIWRRSDVSMSKTVGCVSSRARHDISAFACLRSRSCPFLPRLSQQAIHRSGATLAAENGATVDQLMVIFDWDTPAQAKTYPDAADRKRLAAEAMPLLATGHRNET
jgi:hypothetical protein